MNSSIVTLVSAVAAERITREVAHLGIVRHARGATDAVRVLSEGSVTWLVLDPTVLRLEALDEVLAAGARSGVGVLAHLSMTDEGVERLLHVLRHQALEVQFESHAPRRSCIRERVGRPPLVSIPCLLLHLLAPRLARLPLRVRTLMVSVLCSAPDECETQRLLDCTLTSRRSIDRWLQRAGLQSLAKIARAACVAQSWEPLTHERMTLESVALRAGFGALRTLDAAWRATCGVSPRCAGRTLTPAEVLQRLFASMTLP